DAVVPLRPACFAKRENRVRTLPEARVLRPAHLRPGRAARLPRGHGCDRGEPETPAPGPRVERAAGRFLAFTRAVSGKSHARDRGNGSAMVSPTIGLPEEGGSSAGHLVLRPAGHPA